MEVSQRADGVTVINDAYNASPDSMKAAISALAGIARTGRAYAVLGEMAELGEEADRLHEAVGAQAAAAGLAGLIVVGDAAAPILAGTKAVPSWQGELLHVPDAAAALQAIRERLRGGDVVLVKASHAIGLESVALALTGEAKVSEEGPRR
jgi:UDP-N-acetylmuramoyl-tripeptide--D-alanyl-D-alanine ligase